MNKFNGWESDIDSNGQPILPKQVICVICVAYSKTITDKELNIPVKLNI
jgi:hypothetical protein